MNTTRRAATAAVVLGTLILTAACGGDGSTPGSAKPSTSAPAASTSSPAPASSAASASGSLAGLSADAIVAKAIADTQAASSLHVTNDGGSQGTMDVAITTQGCRASVKSPANNVNLVEVGSLKWLLLDAATVKSSLGDSAGAKAVVGKYLKITKDDPDLADLLTICDVKQQLASAVPYTTGLTRGAPTTVDGVKALTLTSAKGETVLVSDTAQPLLLRVDISGSDAAKLAFSDYNAVPAITAPPAAQTVSVPGL